MNIPEPALETAGYTAKFQAYEELFSRLLGPAQTLLSTETWQTTDYGKFGITMFNEQDRKKRREEIFPQDRQKAFEMGGKIARG
jgi:hypothetical protein